MFKVIGISLNQLKVVTYCLIVLMALFINVSSAQSGVGTVGDVMLDDGYVVINGEEIPYRGGVKITYNNEQVSSVYLKPGLRVSFSLHANGSLKHLRLLGPSKELSGIKNH